MLPIAPRTEAKEQEFLKEVDFQSKIPKRSGEINLQDFEPKNLFCRDHFF